MADRPAPQPIYEIHVDPSYFETPAFRLLVDALLELADLRLAAKERAQVAALTEEHEA